MVYQLCQLSLPLKINVCAQYSSPVRGAQTKVVGRRGAVEPSDPNTPPSESCQRTVAFAERHGLSCKLLIFVLIAILPHPCWGPPLTTVDWDCGLRIVDCGLWIVDRGLWIVDCGLCVSYYYPTLLLSTTCCGGKPLQSTRIWSVLDFCKSFFLVNATVPTENSYLINISSTTIGHMAKHVNQDGPAAFKV